jgi:Putative MetA-pathway of phenol degradation
MLFVMLCCSRELMAQELEPRSFNNIPIDQTFLLFGVGRSEGDLSPTPSSPLQDAELRIDSGVIGLSRTFSLAGDSAKIDVAGARLCYEGSATFQGEYTEGRRCEYADMKLKLTWNFYGAPAMNIQQFRDREKGGLVVGASLAVSAPVGDYDSDHIINAGANRWAFKPTLGMSKRMGRFQLEAKTSVTLFEDNDDFFGGIRAEQDPLYTVSGHLIYLLKRGSWVSLDANYFAGGETTKGGVDGDDRQDNSRWGATWTKPLAPKHVVKLYVSTGVVTRVGNDFDNFGAAYLYRF